jgi:hypothetical protein
MTNNACATTWWPLRVATAWVLSRDRGVTERHACVKGSTPSLFIGFEDATGRPQSFESVKSAWNALHGGMSSGSVRTIGTRFHRIAGTSGGPIGPAESQRQIPWQEIGSLEFYEDGDDQCLVPKDWRVARESNWGNLCGYRNVQVHRDDVLNEFAPGGNRTLTSDMIASDMIGAPVAPEGGGYMPLSQAAYWIVTNGGTNSVDVNDQAAWKHAYDELLAHIASNDVQIVGQSSDGMNEEIDAFLFAGLRVSYPYHDTPSELLFGSEPYIESFPFIDDEHWWKGFNDKLVPPPGGKRRWSRLQVKKEDVRRIWRFAGDPDASMAGSNSHLARPNSRRGRRPKIEWDKVRDFVHEKLEHHGLPQSGDPEWSCQADVERAVAKFIEKRFGISMADSTIRERTVKFIAEWQAGKADN